MLAALLSTLPPGGCQVAPVAFSRTLPTFMQPKIFFEGSHRNRMTTHMERDCSHTTAKLWRKSPVADQQML